MKKSELTQLTQIIEHLVAKEVRKQLPTIIAETFRNMMGKQVVTEEVQSRQQLREEVQNATIEEPEMRASLKELFAGTVPTRMQLDESGNARPAVVAPKQYCKDPKINSILNATRPFSGQERMSMGGSPAVMMAAAQMPSMAATGVGEMMPEAEVPAFARNMPSMPGSLPPGVAPLSRPPQVLKEGQEGGPAPLSELPQDISALDVAKAGMVPNAVGEALTNYDRMRKILNQSKGKRH